MTKKWYMKVLNVLKWVLIVFVSLIVLLLLVRGVGRLINNRTPKGGINETQYVDVNGQQMWINIYGEDKDNPVLLFLHGGPGSSTSYADYVILRKLAKDYTVVNWDQRNCGKTWIKDAQDTPITFGMMRSDIDVLTDYLLDHLGKEKLTVMGISWGSLYALDFAQEHPEKTECVIGMSQDVGYYDGALDYNISEPLIAAHFFKTDESLPEDAKELAEQLDEEKFHDLLVDLTISREDFFADENIKIFTQLNNKYSKELDAYMSANGYDDDMMKELDVNLYTAVAFCPYYSLMDLYKTFVKYPTADNGMIVLSRSLTPELFADENSPTLLDRTDYEMPVYMFLGDRDITCDPKVAEDYFNSINAPYKELRYTNGGHMSTMCHSEELAAFVHDIAEKQKESK